MWSLLRKDLLVIKLSMTTPSIIMEKPDIEQPTELKVGENSLEIGEIYSYGDKKLEIQIDPITKLMVIVFHISVEGNDKSFPIMIKPGDKLNLPISSRIIDDKLETTYAIFAEISSMTEDKVLLTIFDTPKIIIKTEDTPSGSSKPTGREDIENFFGNL